MGALYVRLRVADNHQRPMKRWPIFFAHLGGALFVGWLGAVNSIPVATVVPYLGFLARASWAAVAPRPVSDIKKFGFTELGVEILSGLWLIVVYWMN